MANKIDEQLFSVHKRALAREYEVCPKCGGELTVRHSKHGSFVGCGNYPACDYIRPTAQHENLAAQLISGSECPECGHELAVKSGRYGLFIGCSQYPACQHIEKLESRDEAEVSCPQCHQGALEQRTGRYGKPFYACNRYPKCRFIVNYPPVAEACPECGFGILVKRHGAGGDRLECPSKTCRYRRTLAD